MAKSQRRSKSYKLKIIKQFDNLLEQGIFQKDAAEKLGHHDNVIRRWKLELKDELATEDDHQVIVHSSQDQKTPKRQYKKKSSKLVAIIGTADEISEVLKGI